MVQYYNSGFITFRSRKVGLTFSGQSAQHIMENYVNDRRSHPAAHMRLQQLAKNVKEWKKRGANRYAGEVIDLKTGIRLLIIVDIYTKFAILITGYKN
jgi:hypothetical protein